MTLQMGRQEPAAVTCRGRGGPKAAMVGLQMTAMGQSSGQGPSQLLASLWQDGQQRRPGEAKAQETRRRRRRPRRTSTGFRSRVVILRRALPRLHLPHVELRGSTICAPAFSATNLSSLPAAWARSRITSAAT